jgi:ankyrin repeat protein
MSVPFRATIDAYQAEAEALFAALCSGVKDAAWRFKWEHPRFRGKHVDDVKPDQLALADAQIVIASSHGFAGWDELVAFSAAVQEPGPIATFEMAVEAVVAGDIASLRTMLAADPSLVRARSSRRHHATLLHYLAANGVEGDRQKTPSNAVEVMRLLLAAGAEPDALADMYNEKCTTIGMLVSSTHPHQVGLQLELAETLLDHGAALDGAGSKWQSPIRTALAFGYADTARGLATRVPTIHDLALAAGLGRYDDVTRLYATADAATRHAAFALAAMHGHVDVVRFLLDAGEDPDRYNPDGYHAHSTPLHQAVWANHDAVVRLLVERGARLDLADKIFDGTPLGWASFGNRTTIAEYLRTSDHRRNHDRG